MFQGLGSLQGVYVIKLRPDSKPFAKLSSCSPPKESPRRAKEHGMTWSHRKVDTPTDWCAGMVVVPSVQIFGDLNQKCMLGKTPPWRKRWPSLTELKCSPNLMLIPGSGKYHCLMTLYCLTHFDALRSLLFL